MHRYVADLGNTRIKWAKVRAGGGLEPAVAHHLSDGDAWIAALRACVEAAPCEWAISSVNPPLAAQFAECLASAGCESTNWFRSAADVPVPHDLERPENSGADRALAVLAAMRRFPEGQGGIVISCGTAITVERISPRGVWEGGAIAPGLGIAAQALAQSTAQLPRAAVPEPPPPWGRSTIPAIQAGVYWGTVGAVRELIARQRASRLADSPTIWTGGDAAVLATHVEVSPPVIVPELVLEGLAITAFGGTLKP